MRLQALYSGIILFLFCFLASPAKAVELNFNTEEFPPFNYSEEGILLGPSVEILRRICLEMKITCNVQSRPWRQAEIEVRIGKVQGIFVLAKTEKLEKWLSFSPPLLKTEYGFFVRKSDSLRFKNLTDLVGYRVGVYGPSDTSKYLNQLIEQMKNRRLPPFSTYTAYDEFLIFRMLDFGRRKIKAVYSNRDVGKALAKKFGFNNIRYAGASKHLNYYIAFSKAHTDPALVRQFNQTFRKLHRERVIHQILKKYRLRAAKLD